MTQQYCDTVAFVALMFFMSVGVAGLVIIFVSMCKEDWWK